MAANRGSEWRRVGRRAAVRAGAAGVGLAGLYLAACGGDDTADTQGDGGARAELRTATVQAATTKQPKPGGAVTTQLPTAPPSLDPYTQTSFLAQWVAGFSYSKLMRFRAGVPEVNPDDFTMEPDLAAAMPEQQDPQTLVYKLKPATWHNVPPTNGRALTAEDARYAIDRYANFDRSVWKSSWAYVDKLETPDAQTLVIKTKFPFADAVQIAGGHTGAFISPRELAESPEAATKMVGSGYYLLKEYQTGVSLTFTKNPDYYNAPQPYFDELRLFVVTDTAKRVADFSAKSVNLTYLFLPDERDQIKRNRPDAKSEETQGIGSYIYLRTDKPPFNDKRVRQALSMGINRKAIRDALTKGEGQPDQIIYVGFQDWARPVKDLGPAAKYWDHNPAEAKALLAAAGASNLTFDWSHADAAVYTQPYVDTATLTQAQWKEIGVNVVDKQQPYAQYIASTYQGQYEGVGHSPRSVFYLMAYLSERLYTSSSGQRGRINLSYVNNPQLNQLLDKQRGQFDVAERKKSVTEIETICAEEQYEIYYSTDTRTYFWDPDIENYRPTHWYPFVFPIRAWRER